MDIFNNETQSLEQETSALEVIKTLFESFGEIHKEDA